MHLEVEETKQLTKEFIYHNWKRLFLLTIMLVGTAFFEIVPVVVYMFFWYLARMGDQSVDLFQMLFAGGQVLGLEKK